MMESQIGGFLETSFLDWPGKIAAVLFIPGCNLRCPYCHNHPLVIHPERLETISLEYVLKRLEGLRGWIDGVCISGGEPTLNGNLPHLLGQIKMEGWAIKVDTNGTFPERVAELVGRDLVDCVAMDIKAPLDERSYRRCAGVPVNISAIRQSISVLANGGIDYTLRMTVVPTLLTEGQIYDAARQLVGTGGLLLQDFNPCDPLNPELRGVKPFGGVRVQRMQERVDSILAAGGRQSPTLHREWPLQRMRSSVSWPP